MDFFYFIFAHSKLYLGILSFFSPFLVDIQQRQHPETLRLRSDLAC